MFVPLHIISGYSFLESGLTIEKIVNSIKKNNLIGAGLCDLGVLYGLPSFMHFARDNNFKAVPGITLDIEGEEISLYITSEEGYREICALTPLIKGNALPLETIKGRVSHVTAVLDTNTPAFKELFRDKEAARKTLLEYDKCFKQLYLGIEVTTKEEKAFADQVREFSETYPYDLVAFPKIRYEKEKDAIVIKIVEAIKNDTTLEEKGATGEECFHEEKYYEARYTKTEIDNTEKILNSSTFDYFIKRGNLIKYEVSDSKKELRSLSMKGLSERNLDNKEEYTTRLDKELDVIDSMGYNDYFLVVSDYVKYAKDNKILVGPGRGSAGGSLVAYALKITTIDPIKNDLQFERFLNKSRQSLPDIDVDFMDTRRDEVTDYVRNKYTHERVANIVTFQTILAKQALRDIGRVYGYNAAHIDRLCKMLSRSNESLKDCYRHIKEFREEVDRDKYVLEIVTLASYIEFLPRQEGIHAAGVVLNNDALETAIPVKVDIFGNYITQYSMEYLEEQGFLKMDFLGIRNLTTIDECIKLISRTRGIELDPSSLDYDRKETYELICSANTMGIFQLESAGMKRAIKTLEPSCFDDVVALLALFRPGPMESIPEYAKRKKLGANITYSSPEMEKILAPTYGIIVYQEQVSSIATAMAGLSGDEADNFRRAVSKKDKEKMKSLKSEFVDGAVKNGYSEKEGEETFALIERFASYGFNKSHAVGYATVTMMMSYLKAMFPLEFYTTALNYASSSSDFKFNEYLYEIKKSGYKVLLPSVNVSSTKFELYNGDIYYPLSGIKNIPQAFVNLIITERENGPFTDFYDFMVRMYPYKITENQVSKLIDAGAFDTLNPSRASLRASIVYAMQYAKLAEGDRGMLNLAVSLPKPRQIVVEDDPKENLEKEYESLSTVISSSPLDFYSEKIRAYKPTPISDATSQNKEYTLAGLIISRKIITTKSKSQMAFIKIFDDSGEIEMTVFPSLYAKVGTSLSAYSPVIVRGKIDKETFVADDIILVGDSNE
ncbi:MAG: DNA polymerase III subunit alpha [Coprobacillus sp.]|nr:DNA polymerase III subunit alpha [Coprobacillus sp.]